MMNKICVILTTAAALICLLVLVTGDNSHAIEDKSSQAQSVSDDRIQIVVKEDGNMPYAINIAVGIVLIGGAAAVCGLCVRELRKERFSPFDNK